MFPAGFRINKILGQLCVEWLTNKCKYCIGIIIKCFRNYKCKVSHLLQNVSFQYNLSVFAYLLTKNYLYLIYWTLELP